MAAIDSFWESTVWEAGSYDPATWQPDPDNVLPDWTFVATSAVQLDGSDTDYGKFDSTKATAIPLLCDGSVASVTNCVRIKGSYLRWSSSQPKDIVEVRIFTRGFDGRYDGIALEKMKCKSNGKSIGDSPAFAYGAKDDSTSGALYAILRNVDGDPVIPACTEFEFTFDSKNGETGGAFYAEVELICESGYPNVQISAQPAGPGAVNLNGKVLFPGNGGSQTAVSYVVARHGDPLPAATAFGSFEKGATFSIPLSGLEWNREYDYAVTVQSGFNDVRTYTGTFTSCPATLDAGLWEVLLDGATTWTTDAMAIPLGTDADLRHRELGTEMAYTNSSFYSALNDATYSWQANSHFAYVGYIRLKADTTYTFQSSINTAVYIKIDDTVVKNLSAKQDRHNSTFTTGSDGDGWHPVEMRFGVGSGNDKGQINSRVGIRVSTDGGTTWNKIRDPGDGSFLRTRVDAPISIPNIQNTDSGLKLTLAFRDDFAGATPVVGTAPSADSGDWNDNEFTVVAAGEATRVVTVVPESGDTVFRAVLSKDGTDYWTKVFHLADYEVSDGSAPVATFTGTGTITASSADVLVSVASTGDGFDACDLTVDYGTEPTSLTKSATSGGHGVGNATVSLDGLVPGRVYYGRVTAGNASSTSNPGELFSFTTPAAESADPAGGIVVGGYAVTNGTLYADLAFDPAVSGEEASLTVAFGATCGGDSPEDWDDASTVAAIAGGADAYAFAGLSGAGSAAAKFVRFFLVDASGTRRSETLYLPGATEVLLASTVSVDSHLGDSLVVTGALVSAGSGDYADVSALVATRSDLSDAVVWNLGSFASGSPVVATLHEGDTAAASYITPGAAYYVALVAEDGNGAKDRTSAVSTRTLAGCDMDGAVSASSVAWTATFKGTLATHGAGDSTVVTLYTGADADHLEAAGIVEMAEAGNVEFTVTFPDFGTVYYKMVAQNSCGTASWTDETSVGSVTLFDDAVYTWNPAVADGFWSDPANWICNVSDARLQYPNSAGCTVLFSECTMPTTVRVDGQYTVGYVTNMVSKGGLDVTFVGGGREQTSLALGDGGKGEVFIGDGTRVVFDNLYVLLQLFTFGDGATLRLQNGAFLEDKDECKMGNNGKAFRLEVTGDSTFYANHNHKVRMIGPSSYFLLEDSTFYGENVCFAPASNSSTTGPCIVEFAGTHPLLTPKEIISNEEAFRPLAVEFGATFSFNVPMQGYTGDAVIVVPDKQTFPAKDAANNNGEKVPIYFYVPKSSGWFQQSMTEAFRLVEAPNGILTDWIAFPEQGRPENTRFYYTYGEEDRLEPSSENEKPTGLWVELKGNGASIILFR